MDIAGQNTAKKQITLKQLHAALCHCECLYIELTKPTEREKLLSHLLFCLAKDIANNALTRLIYEYDLKWESITRNPDRFRSFVVRLGDELQKITSQKAEEHFRHVSIIMNSIKHEEQLLKQRTLIQIAIEIALLKQALKKRYTRQYLIDLLHNNILFWKDIVSKINPAFIDPQLMQKIKNMQKEILQNKVRFQISNELIYVHKIMLLNIDMNDIFTDID